MVILDAPFAINLPPLLDTIAIKLSYWAHVAIWQVFGVTVLITPAFVVTVIGLIILGIAAASIGNDLRHLWCLKRQPKNI